CRLCSSEPNRKIGIVPSDVCAATVIATDESMRVSSSIAIAYETVSPPAPPYSSGIGIPISPIDAISATSSYGNRPSRSSSAATGATRVSANSRTVSCRSFCSSLRSKFTRLPRRRRLPPSGAGLRRRLTTLAAGCCARSARAYSVYCPSRRSLASFASVARGTRVSCSDESRRAQQHERERAERDELLDHHHDSGELLVGPAGIRRVQRMEAEHEHVGQHLAAREHRRRECDAPADGEPLVPARIDEQRPHEQSGDDPARVLGVVHR